MQLFSKRQVKIVLILLLVVLTVYMIHLNNQVKAEFSNPLKL